MAMGTLDELRRRAFGGEFIHLLLSGDSGHLGEVLENLEGVGGWWRSGSTKRQRRSQAASGSSLRMPTLRVPKVTEILNGADLRSLDRIGRRGIDSSERLGQYRWVVEWTLSWLNRYRRLKVRYERRADIHEAFLHLGCSLICLNYLSS